MIQRVAPLCIVVALLTAVLACSDQRSSLHSHPHEPDPREDEALKYLMDNYPSREQMLSVHECVYERTGYEFGELPEDFGPELLMHTRPADVERPPEETLQAYQDCIFFLGLEDRFFPPWEHEALLSAADS